MLVATDPPPAHHAKRRYPEPCFAVERSGAVGGKGSYPIRFKLRIVEFTRVICEDGQEVGDSGAAKVLKIDRRRVVDRVGDEAKMRKAIERKPSSSKAKATHPGVAPSTASAEEQLTDFINEQRKAHRGCGSKEVMNKLLELKSDALGGLSATATPEEADGYRAKFDNWYRRFRARHGLSIRRRISVGQTLPKDTGVWRGRR